MRPYDGRVPETAGAWHALLDALAGLEPKVEAVGDDQSALEGYKWMASILQVALDTQVWADAANPSSRSWDRTRSGEATTRTPFTSSPPSIRIGREYKKG